MLNLNQLNKTQLLEPKNFEMVNREAQSIVDNLDTQKAWNLAKELYEKLELEGGRELSEIEKKYINLIAKLHWVALPVLPDEKVINLFKKWLLNAFSLNFDVVKRLKVKIISLSLSERSNFKKNLIEALHQNIQTISRRPVEEWLKDYDQNFGPKKISPHEIKEYQEKNPKAANLKIEDQRPLHKLFFLYESLKTTGATLEDLEERILIKDEKGEFSTLRKETEETFVPETHGKPLSELKEEIKKTPLPRGKAAYYIDAEDEEEIKGFHDKLKEYRPRFPLDYDLIVQKIVRSLELTFSDEISGKRFEGLVISRLRDIRTSFQLKKMLEQTEKLGGMAYSENLADQVVAIAEEEHKKIHEVKGEEEPTLEKVSEIETPPVEKRPGAVKTIEVAPGSKTLETIKSRMKGRVSEEEVEKPLPQIPETAPVAPPPPPPTYRKLSFQRPKETVSEPRVVDIKKPPRPIGPVEELKEINLTDFRRLGDSVSEAVKKITEKISLLEEESLVKRAQGIKAWLSSEVCRIYLDIGRESMGSNKTLEEIINDRVVTNKPYLTLEEFNAIADLNTHLRL